MKAFLLCSLLFSCSLFAQTLSLPSLKNLFTEKQSSLEAVHAGMSKKLVTASTVETETGECSYTQTSIQTVLKVEGTNLVVHAEESFSPEASEACKEAGFEAYQENLVFFEEKPTLTSELAEFDAAAQDIRTISRNGQLVSVVMKDYESEGDITLTYDLSQSGFRNMVSTTGPDFTIKGQNLSDKDVMTIDLTNVLFCESNDGDNSDCVEGDYSDILF